MGPDDLGYRAEKRTPPATPGDAPGGSPGDAPLVALRLVTSHDGADRRIDVGLGGAASVLTVDGTSTTFPTTRLWPVLRDLLPPLEHVRAAPRGRAPARTAPGGADTPGPGFVEDCRASVVVATVVDDQVTVRTWLATDDALWSVEPRPDGTTRTTEAPAGALADLLVWDVTAALEALVLADRSAS